MSWEAVQEFLAACTASGANADAVASVLATLRYDPKASASHKALLSVARELLAIAAADSASHLDAKRRRASKRQFEYLSAELKPAVVPLDTSPVFVGDHVAQIGRMIQLINEAMAATLGATGPSLDETEALKDIRAHTDAKIPPRPRLPEDPTDEQLAAHVKAASAYLETKHQAIKEVTQDTMMAAMEQITLYAFNNNVDKPFIVVLRVLEAVDAEFPMTGFPPTQEPPAVPGFAAPMDLDTPAGASTPTQFLCPPLASLFNQQATSPSAMAMADRSAAPASS